MEQLLAHVVDVTCQRLVPFLIDYLVNEIFGQTAAAACYIATHPGTQLAQDTARVILPLRQAISHLKTVPIKVSVVHQRRDDGRLRVLRACAQFCSGVEARFAVVVAEGGQVHMRARVMQEDCDPLAHCDSLFRHEWQRVLIGLQERMMKKKKEE